MARRIEYADAALADAETESDLDTVEATLDELDQVLLERVHALLALGLHRGVDL